MAKGTKTAAAEKSEDPSDPNERVLPPIFSEESLAAISFDSDAPFTDPEERVLPSGLDAVAASWERPSTYLAPLCEDGATPYVVQPPVPGAGGGAPSRELPNLLEYVPPADSFAEMETAEARRALQWMVSCMQLVAIHAPSVDEGCFLWELIHPQVDGRPRHVPSGKYAVKLFEQGAWRLVTVDDRMPFDASGAAMLPRSTAALELWPFLLAKAIYKLASGAASDLNQDPTVLLRMTGWLPQTVPISPRLPLAAAWGELHARIHSGDCVLGLMLPAAAEADAALASVGLHRGPLVAVLGVREVEGEHYVRIQSEQLQWGGELRDTDEDSWTPALSSALDWKRWQRLRIRAAGLPLHDAWLRQPSLNAHFAAVLVLHRPAALQTIAWYQGTCDQRGVTPPALLMVPGAPDAPPATLLLGLQASPATREPGGGGVQLALQTHAWEVGSEPQTLLELDSAGSKSLRLSLRRGTPYRLALSGRAEPAPERAPEGDGEEAAEATGDEAAPPAEAGEATDAVEGAPGAAAASPAAGEGGEPAAAVAMVAPPCRFAVAFCCDEAVQVGSVAEVAGAQLGLSVSTLEGELPELPAGEWRLALGVSLKPTAACTLNATLRLTAPRVAACARLHVLDEESCSETGLLGLATGPLALAPTARGHTLLLDVKSAEALPACGWVLQVSADAEVDVTEVALKPPHKLEEAYAPNQEFCLFRVVLDADSKSAAAVHVATSEPTAELLLRVLQVQQSATDGVTPAYLRPVESEVKAAEGLGCASLLGVGLEPAPAPAGNAGKKGAAPTDTSQPVTVLECRVKQRCAERLGLPIKPPPEPKPTETEVEGAAAPPSEPPPPSLDWSLTVASAAQVNLKKDSSLETALAAVRDGWEAAQPGRAAKAKAVREEYLAQLAAAAAEAGAPAVALGGKVDKVSMIDAATGLAAVDLKRRGGAAKPSVVSAETREAAVAEHEAALAALAEEREAAEKKREEAREKREAALAEQLEAMRAKRALQLETYATMDAEREAMMTTALPEKVAAEPIDDPKVKGKKDDPKAAKGKKK